MDDYTFLLEPETAIKAFTDKGMNLKATVLFCIFMFEKCYGLEVITSYDEDNKIIDSFLFGNAIYPKYFIKLPESYTFSKVTPEMVIQAYKYYVFERFKLEVLETYKDTKFNFDDLYKRFEIIYFLTKDEFTEKDFRSGLQECYDFINTIDAN